MYSLVSILQDTTESLPSTRDKGIRPTNINILVGRIPLSRDESN